MMRPLSYVRVHARTLPPQPYARSITDACSLQTSARPPITSRSAPRFRNLRRGAQELCYRFLGVLLHPFDGVRLNLGKARTHLLREGARRIERADHDHEVGDLSVRIVSENIAARDAKLTYLGLKNQDVLVSIADVAHIPKVLKDFDDRTEDGLDDRLPLIRLEDDGAMEDDVVRQRGLDRVEVAPLDCLTEAAAHDGSFLRRESPKLSRAQSAPPILRCPRRATRRAPQRAHPFGSR